jgi:hypothetical protein
MTQFQGICFLANPVSGLIFHKKGNPTENKIKGKNRPDLMVWIKSLE